MMKFQVVTSEEDEDGDEDEDEDGEFKFSHFKCRISGIPKNCSACEGLFGSRFDKIFFLKWIDFLGFTSKCLHCFF